MDCHSILFNLLNSSSISPNFSNILLTHMTDTWISIWDWSDTDLLFWVSNEIEQNWWNIQFNLISLTSLRIWSCNLVCRWRNNCSTMCNRTDLYPEILIVENVWPTCFSVKRSKIMDFDWSQVIDSRTTYSNLNQLP